MAKNEKIKEAKSELEKLEMSAEDRELYELRLKAIRDEINIRESGYTDGMRDGMRDGEEKGKRQGELQKSLEIAKAMLKKQMPIELIQELTGLSQSEIEKIND